MKIVKIRGSRRYMAICYHHKIYGYIKLSKDLNLCYAVSCLSKTRILFTGCDPSLNMGWISVCSNCLIKKDGINSIHLEDILAMLSPYDMNNKKIFLQ